MARYALVDRGSGAVVNVIEYDGAPLATPHRLVAVPPGVAVDDRYAFDGAAFVAPPPEPAAETAKAAAVRVLAATATPLAAALEDVVDVLTAKQVLRLDELPAASRSVLAARRAAHAVLGTKDGKATMEAAG